MEKVKSSLLKEVRLIKEATTQKLIIALLIVLLFITFPIGVTHVTDYYYQHLDQTVYYEIKNPVTILQDDIHSCDTITLLFNVNSLVETSGVSHKVLMRVDTMNTLGARVATTNTDIPITKTKGFETKPIQMTVPCGLSEGEYYFYAVVTFDANGINKTAYWQSILFKVSIKS